MFKKNNYCQISIYFLDNCVSLYFEVNGKLYRKVCLSYINYIEYLNNNENYYVLPYNIIFNSLQEDIKNNFKNSI
jgi:hypothetical protein